MPKKIIVLFDPNKKQILAMLNSIRPWLESMAQITGWHSNVLDISKTENKVDYIIVFGGDGLLLAVARHICEQAIPVIGINFGKLGFLAEFSVPELLEYLGQILEGKCSISSRMMLSCEIEKENGQVNKMVALNDAVIKCTSTSRMIYISISINNEPIASYGGDGIIVSTPIGSTAYSLSAGGPIVSPDLSSLLITPICPHVLTLRPLIISPLNIIELKLIPPYPGDSMLIIDGQVNFSLGKNDKITISESKHKFYLVRTEQRSFFRILQEKLSWGFQQ